MKLVNFTSALLFGILLSSCNQDKIAELEEKNRELMELNSKGDTSINEMMGTFNQIQLNLNEIKYREGIIEDNSVEGNSKDIGKNIQADIEAINQLMQENEKLINNLNKKLSSSNVQIAEFKNIVKNLNTRVKSKNEEIAKLSTELQNKKILIGQLYFQNDSLAYSKSVTEKELEETIDELNKAYYAYGTFKELKEKNVLTKEGGFLGIGKNEELKDNFNTDYFSSLDIRKQKSFLLYAEKAELATNHPKNSYKIMGADGKADSLVITNPNEFWKTSRYLVIVIN